MESNRLVKVNSRGKLSRRRFISIVAGCPLVFGSGVGLARNPEKYLRFENMFGSRVGITLYHHSKSEAEQLLEKSFSEAKRLETILSLYNDNSLVSKLNKDGKITEAPSELVELINYSKIIGRRTFGAFDISVQPLWNLYHQHYSRVGADEGKGPSKNAVSEALGKVNYKLIDVRGGTVSFLKPGMSITLNGIAQGYITDKVTSILLSAGIKNVLANIGEYRGAGEHPSGQTWKVGIADPEKPWDYSEILPVRNVAVATSGGYGYPFSRDMKNHHIFDPRLGCSANHYRSLTIEAPSATLADALSTGLYALDPKLTEQVLSEFPGAKIISQIV